MDILDRVLTELGFAPPVRRLYRFLAEAGPSSARTIAERMSLPRPSVYDHVAPLIAHGIASLIEQDGKKVFAVSSVDDLYRLVKEKEERIASVGKALDAERASIARSIESIVPKIKFYEGRDGLVTLFGDFLWSGADEIVSVWPYHEMLEVFGSDTLEEFNRKRIKHKIALRTVWTERPSGAERIWKGGDWKVERRFAPRGFRPSMGFTAYGNRVAFMSSKDERYGFIVESRDFAALKRAEFELLWKQST
jgi:DNA-binding transcriptional ArsR family regulator